MQDYHRLEIWKRAIVYVGRINQLCEQLPDTERYNLASQLRKAATSVPLNIAEGAGCLSNSEFAHFLTYAYRSLKEVMASLELCRSLSTRLTPEQFDRLIDEGDQIARMTYRLLERLTSESGRPLRGPRHAR